MSDDAAQSIFEQLVLERGGSSKLNVTELALANKLASLLADNADVPGSTISTLLSLLPSPLSTEAEALDLTLLSDKDLDQLDRLNAIARGEKPPTPQKPRRHPQRSHREHVGQELAVLCDQLEAEGDAARRRDWKNVPRVSEDDLAAIRHCFVSMLGAIATESAVFRYLIEGAQYEVRKEFRDREAANAPAEPAGVDAGTAPAGAAAAAPEKRDNVVKPLSWGLHTAPRTHVGDRPIWDRPL